MDLEESFFLSLVIEYKKEGEYIPVGKSVVLDEFCYWPIEYDLYQPRSWEKMCKRIVYLLKQSYRELNYNHQVSPEEYYRERLSKMKKVSFSSPLYDWNDDNFVRRQQSISAVENQSYCLIDLLLIHNILSFSSRMLQYKIETDKMYTTSMGHILIQYIPVENLDAEQGKATIKTRMKVYKRKETNDELIMLREKIVTFSYNPSTFTKAAIVSYLQYIDDYEFTIIKQLDFNKKSQLSEYLEKYFRSLDECNR